MEYSWHKVFENEEEAKVQVPLRQTKLLAVAGKEICLAHTAAGLVAIQDACPHMGHSLSRGKLSYLDEVVCPWHSYRYSLHNGKECDYRTRNATIYPLAIREGGVYIGLQQKPAQ
ncbi:Rieske 2Fe-2S domain-containing protein [Pontibacter qinzhouensis]|uniref:Rieske 2Fe-2S domain-containing protein n=1 Tax=Pontibacter qinzhouensis TaxID=2603253 RepID=A0A5C8JI47_9BACT|nr:Rieske 2Fe-2S domain-containing protein [Pontibacter qinzhouensis]TXK38010.1 Rieske 2Fe-2S domain-containing protein [Pontibacter qinzhouensis]